MLGGGKATDQHRRGNLGCSSTGHMLTKVSDGKQSRHYGTGRALFSKKLGQHRMRKSPLIVSSLSRSHSAGLSAKQTEQIAQSGFQSLHVHRRGLRTTAVAGRTHLLVETPTGADPRTADPADRRCAKRSCSVRRALPAKTLQHVRSTAWFRLTAPFDATRPWDRRPARKSLVRRTAHEGFRPQARPAAERCGHDFCASAPLSDSAVAKTSSISRNRARAVLLVMQRPGRGISMGQRVGIFTVGKVCHWTSMSLRQGCDPPSSDAVSISSEMSSSSLLVPHDHRLASAQRDRLPMSRDSSRTCVSAAPFHRSQRV